METKQINRGGRPKKRTPEIEQKVLWLRLKEHKKIREILAAIPHVRQTVVYEIVNDNLHGHLRLLESNPFEQEAQAKAA